MLHTDLEDTRDLFRFRVAGMGKGRAGSLDMARAVGWKQMGWLAQEQEQVQRERESRRPRAARGD